MLKGKRQIIWQLEKKWQVQGNIPLKKIFSRHKYTFKMTAEKKHKKASIEINFENLGNEKEMACKNESE